MGERCGVLSLSFVVRGKTQADMNGGIFHLPKTWFFVRYQCK